MKAGQGRRALAALALAAILLVGCGQTGGQATPPKDSDDNNAAYLQLYYGVAFSATPNEAAFVEALTRVQPRQAAELAPDSPDAALTGLKAVQYAVAGANMQELAKVYTAEKTSKALEGIGKVDEAYAPYLACALDLGMLDAAQAKALAKDGEIDAALANALVMGAATVNGTARNYMGYTSDADIYSKVMNFWEALDYFDDPVLTDIGVTVLMDKIGTGYGLSRHSDDARFLPELTLRYGQDDIVHAIQMIGLLNSEGIVARLQLEPKVSVYEYLPEWGDPGEPTPTYEVRKLQEDFWLVYTLEYDLALEFASKEDRDRLDAIVHEYAKKNSGEEGKDLLYASWWQPVYESKVEMGEGYHAIFDHVIDNGEYYIHFRTNEDILAPLKGLTRLEVVQTEVWVDAPFYRYFLGEAE